MNWCRAATTKSSSSCTPRRQASAKAAKSCRRASQAGDRRSRLRRHRHDASASKPAPVTAASAHAPVAATKLEAAASATDFVFVEPSYQAEECRTTAPADEPATATARLEAAAKFVDKPEGNLLPAPSAAMQPQAAQAPPTAPIQPAVNLAAEQKGESHIGHADQRPPSTRANRSR